MTIEYINPNGIKIYLSEFKWIEKQKVRDAIKKLKVVMEYEDEIYDVIVIKKLKEELGL